MSNNPTVLIPSDLLSPVTRQWEVSESTPDDGRHVCLRLLHVVGEGEFCDVDYKSHLQALSRHLLFPPHAKNCDGVAVHTYEDKAGLIFVELKSTFSTQHLEEGLTQLLLSLIAVELLREHALLSHVRPEPLRLVMACHPYKNEAQEAKVKLLLNQCRQTKERSFLYPLLWDLLDDGEVQVVLDDLLTLASQGEKEGLSVFQTYWQDCLERAEWPAQKAFVEALQQQKIVIHLHRSAKKDDRESTFVLPTPSCIC